MTVQQIPQQQTQLGVWLQSEPKGEREKETPKKEEGKSQRERQIMI